MRHPLLFFVAIFALSTGTASSASTVLYTQNGRQLAGGIPSQNFEESYDRYDSRSADDFQVPKGKTWTISEVDVIGAYFDGVGLAVSENVTFYTNAGGLPGAIVKDYTGLPGSDNGSGALNIKIPKTKLKTGTYWVSVQVNMDFSSGGEWAWKSQDTSVGLPAAWENPNDGFGTGCTTYTAEFSCFDDGFGDHLFTLKGKSK
jgi:hypothetical protein